MIELITDAYGLIMSGVCIAAIIAAVIYWYMISVDLKQRKKFDKKYRASRDVKSSW
jgi:high-affinity Fe2+/Pb2+ permease